MQVRNKQKLSPDQQVEYYRMRQNYGAVIANNYREHCFKNFDSGYTKNDKFKLCKYKKCGKRFYLKDIGSTSVFDKQKYCCKDCKDKGRKF